MIIEVAVGILSKIYSKVLSALGVAVVTVVVDLDMTSDFFWTQTYGKEVGSFLFCISFPAHHTLSVL